MISLLLPIWCLILRRITSRGLYALIWTILSSLPEEWFCFSSLHCDELFYWGIWSKLCFHYLLMFWSLRFITSGVALSMHNLVTLYCSSFYFGYFWLSGTEGSCSFWPFSLPKHLNEQKHCAWSMANKIVPRSVRLYFSSCF